MSDETTLLPCPFCGGKARVSGNMTRADNWVVCTKCAVIYPAKTNREYTEAEAIAAWNSRAPIEYDGWFYLPKPKEGIVDYGELEITRTENGYKVRQTADVVDEAARKWGEELGEYVMRRICEVWNSRADYHGYEQAAIEAWESIKAWNSRAERTCRDASVDSSTQFYCSLCECTVDVPLLWGEVNYCPNCGRKIERGDE